MGLFERRGGDRRKNDSVEIEPALDQLRYAWDPTTLQADLQHLAAEANINGYHLWDSNARLQLCASATWMAAVRQVSGNVLLSHAEALDEDRKVPQDVADLSELNFSEVQRWLEFRQATFSDGSSVPLPDDFDIEIRLPHADTASAELMNGLKSATEQLLFIHYPALETVVDGSFRKPLFNQFRTYLEYERDQLQTEAAQLNKTWDDELDPQQPEGSVQYQKIQELYNKATQLGITSLIPGLSDDRYRLILKHRPQPQSTPTTPPKPSATPHQPFDPTLLKPHFSSPPAPERAQKPFTPPDFSQPAQTPPDETPEKPFTPPRFDEEEVPAPKKPFDPSQILGNPNPPKKPFDPNPFKSTEQ
jgi:hypothetical protein